MTTDKNKPEQSLPWMKAVKLNSLLSVLLSISVIGNVGQAISMAWLFPLKEKIPYFVEFRSASNNFVVVQAAEGEMRANGPLVRMFLRRYVMDRELVDKATESERYARVISMSNDTVSADFQKIYGNKKTGLFYQENFTRSIEIVRDTPLAQGVHQLELVTTDTITARDKIKNIQSEWVVTLTYTFADQRVSSDKMLFNPIGLFVEQYTLSKRKKAS